MMVTVSAIFTGRGKSETREVRLELRGEWVHMLGGPTGYESLPASAVDDFRWPRQCGGWVANSGDGRHDECLVPTSEMRRAFRELGVKSFGSRSR